ncbi:hypothetical protein EVAR_65104_1 [Eumeta japonica]|uniref:Uncharacterized protein n=1 Tax=Eumeta variegata TaxID=151549 RepID=A0A4C1ZTC9_EUMVA|nr:hypothetical protein EVAR_65104_1 [Eumeta japonica]
MAGKVAGADPAAHVACRPATASIVCNGPLHTAKAAHAAARRTSMDRRPQVKAARIDDPLPNRCLHTSLRRGALPLFGVHVHERGIRHLRALGPRQGGQSSPQEHPETSVRDLKKNRSHDVQAGAPPSAAWSVRGAALVFGSTHARRAACVSPRGRRAQPRRKCAVVIWPRQQYDLTVRSDNRPPNVNRRRAGSLHADQTPGLDYRVGPLNKLSKSVKMIEASRVFGRGSRTSFCGINLVSPTPLQPWRTPQPQRFSANRIWG